MDVLITFALWAGLAFVVMRFGSGAHAMVRRAQRNATAARGGIGGHQTPGWTTPEWDIDPVCSERVRTINAKPSVHDGQVYHFCSRDCREIFEAAPELYLGGVEPRQHGPEHSHA